MRMMARLFVSWVVVMVLAWGFETQASQSLRSPVRETLDLFFLEWDQASTSESQARAVSRFSNGLLGLADQGLSRAEVVSELRSIVLDHQTEAELDGLILAINAGVLTSQEIQSTLIDIVRRCQATGAYFMGDPKRALRDTGALQVVLVYLVAAAGVG